MYLQSKIDAILKFLARHGIDVGEGFDVLPQNAVAEEPEGEVDAENIPQNGNEPTHNTSSLPCGISDVAVARLVSRLERVSLQLIFLCFDTNCVLRTKHFEESLIKYKKIAVRFLSYYI